MSFTDILDFENPVPHYSSTDRETFLNHLWQDKNSVTRFEQIEALVGDAVSSDVMKEIKDGLTQVGMSIRLNPYMLELIDWNDLENDPIRRQFLPMASEIETDHPCMSVDSLNERSTSPVPNLVHRYTDKVLFLVTTVCPVYCQFCTRSYAVGQDTSTLKKDNSVSPKGWDAAIAYIRSNPEIEDVVISGGDIARLKPQHVMKLGEELLNIEHIRRIRFATKALAVQPMKFITDEKWFKAIADVAHLGRSMFKSVYIHSHFNHPREVTPIVEQAMRRLFAEGIHVRNQSVLLRGVNDDADTLTDLIKKLSRVNIQPYYVYSCDMVQSAEHFRVSIQDMQDLERNIRGATAGFNTPLFIVDTPGGGGKRDVHSYEYYNEDYGIYGYRSPLIDPNKMYYYFDPLRSLNPIAQFKWSAPGGRERILSHLGITELLQTAA
ncbi:MAG: KamA family radical SAM protein [Pseudomonadota bacterium]